MEMDSLAVAGLLLRRLEGMRLAPYRDIVGLWTIGCGNRCLADGTPVTGTTAPITEAEAVALMSRTVSLLRDKLRALLHVQLTPCQEGAVLSWQYNVGTAAAASSTLLRMLNAGRFDEASAQFPVWNKIRDRRTGRLVVSQGLVNRREIERSAFLGRLPGAPPAPTSAPPPAPPQTPHLSTAALNAAELARVEG